MGMKICAVVSLGLSALGVVTGGNADAAVPTTLMSGGVVGAVTLTWFAARELQKLRTRIARLERKAGLRKADDDDET